LSQLKEQFHEVIEETATARLPNIDIEIIHRRAPHGDSEQFLINLQAAPSFDAFARFLEQANPFVFWAQATKLAWFSWMDAAQFAMLPLSFGTALSPPKTGPRSVPPRRP
jgi:hypothetical protein